MRYDDLARVGRCLLAGGVLVTIGCGEPVSPAGLATFNAEVRGTVNERISGTASAGTNGWMREFAAQITISGETISVIALAGDRGQTISFARTGADFPLGTHQLGSVGPGRSMPRGGFSSGYGLRKANGIQLFFADSGSLTITEAGNRVSGTFTLYATDYQVIPFPTPDAVGKPIIPIETGKGDITVTGSFSAPRRNPR